MTTQTDTIVSTLHITLTDEQKAYLEARQDEPRTKLTKQFNTAFKTDYSKIQIVMTLLRLKEPIKPAVVKKRQPAAKQSGVPNVIWDNRRERWIVRFMVDKRSKDIAYRKNLADATRIANQYREDMTNDKR